MQLFYLLFIIPSHSVSHTHLSFFLPPSLSPSLPPSLSLSLSLSLSAYFVLQA